MPAKTILAVIDPSVAEPQPVLERAAWLAARAGAAVELFACDYNSEVETGPVAKVWSSEPGIRERILLEHRKRLDRLAEPLRARGLTVTVDVTWDYPHAEAIVKKVAASPPWLVAKDTAFHNVVQRALLTNADWYLIRHCPVPLLLVKPRMLAAQPTILAAVDPLHDHDKPAQLDEAIMRFATDLARGAGAGLDVVHAFALPMNIPMPPDARELVMREHREAMAGFMRGREIADENIRLLEGRADECLQRAARERNADFIVMGAVARRGLHRLFIGSTAERVLDKLPCDLVIIKPANFAPNARAS
jgi:universal stress protein E